MIFSSPFSRSVKRLNVLIWNNYSLCGFRRREMKKSFSIRFSSNENRNDYIIVKI